MIHRICIPGWRPVPDNELVGANRYAAARRKKQDAAMVATYAILSNAPHAIGRRRVQLEITLKGRQQETDPMAYQKSLLDALVKCRLLIDDTTEFVEWIPPTYDRIGEARTTIVLEDIA